MKHSSAAMPPPPLTPAGPPPASGKAWLWLAGIIVILAATTAYLLHRHKAAQPPPSKAAMARQAVKVAMVAARKGEMGIYVNALGAVTPVYTVAVRSRVDGQLMKVYYKEGQMVHEGDPLAEIDSGPYQAMLTQAEGQYARDKALLENALIDLERYQIAYASNAVPKQTLDTQQATVHQFQGAVQFDQGQVDNAKVQLAYCHITSPLTGRVGLRLVDPGNIVHASDSNPLVVVTELQPITVIFSVAEDFLPQIQQGVLQGQKLAVDAFDREQQKKIASGTLLTLDNQIDPATGTVKLKAEFPNADLALFPSQFVNVRLLVDTRHDATIVPAVAVQRNTQGPFVYIVNSDHTIAMKSVTVATTVDDMSAIDGIDPGQLVVSDNFNRLQEGMKVEARGGSSHPAHPANPAGPTQTSSL